MGICLRLNSGNGFKSSFNGKHTFTVERITVTEVREDKESGSITLRYEVSVTFKFINTNEEKRITDVGEARFINEDGVWKIENDWYDWDQEYFKT